MKLTNVQREDIEFTIEDMFFHLKARLLGKYFTGPKIYFEVVEQTNPLETLEGVYNFTYNMLYGAGAKPNPKRVKQLMKITGNYLDAERLRTVNHVLNAIESAKTFDEVKEVVEKQMDKTNGYVNMLVGNEIRNVQANAEKEGIEKLGAAIGVEDPVVCKLGVVDDKLCKYCRPLWHTEENPMVPKVYKLSELKDGYMNHKDPEPTILASHPHCFTEGKIPVLTEKGWKKLKDIQVGEKVLTHTGKYKKVTAVINEPYKEKPVYIIKYKYNNRTFKMNITPDHRLMTQSGWKRADELCVTDKLSQLVYPCAMCDKQVSFRNKAKLTFKLSATCSPTCYSKLVQQNTKQYHDNMTEEQKMIRAANCSEGTSNYILKTGNKGFFSKKEYWTKEKRDEQSDIIKSRMPQMLKASASTRISREQKLAFGWLKSHFNSENIVMEHSVDRFALDIAFVESKIAIEIDGKYHQGDRLLHDKKRDEILNSMGWTVLRFGKNAPLTVSKKNLIGSVQNVMNNHDGRFSFTPSDIISIKKGSTNWQSRIYCLTVDEDESFIARGIVSHNCRHVLSMVPPGFGFSDKGVITFKGFGYDIYAEQRGE